MKKYKHVLLSVFVACTVLLTPFFYAHKVSALALTPGTTTAYGSYMAETYKAFNASGAQASVEVWGVNITLPMGDASSAFHFHYQLNDSYSGSLTINITNSGQWVLNDCSFAVSGGWFHKGDNATASNNGIPSLSATTATKKFVIDFYNTTEIDFVIVSDYSTVFSSSTTFTLSFTSTASHTIEEYLQDIYGSNQYQQADLETIQQIITLNCDYKLSDMADTLSDIIRAVYDGFDYQIPLDRVGAFDLFRNVSNGIYVGGYSTSMIVYHNDTPLPYIWVDDGRTGKFYAYKDRTYYLSYAKIRDGNFSLSDDFTLYSENANQSYTVERIDNVVYTTILNGLYVVTYKIDVTGSNGYIRYTPTHDFSVYPLFFGRDDSYISDETASFTTVPINSQYVSLIEQILAEIEDIDFGGSNVDRTLYDNAVESFRTFMRGIDPISTSKAQIDLDIQSASDITVDETTDTLYPALQLTNIMYTGLTSSFPWLKTFIIMSLSVIVLKVIFA